MFRGSSFLNLDDKGRIAIPTKYRLPLRQCCEGQLVVTIGIEDPCLMVFARPDFEKVEQQLNKCGAFDAKAKRIKRILVGHAVDCEMDGQGRFVIGESLRRDVGLDKRVALVGQGKIFEIWDEDTWNEHRGMYRAQETRESLNELSPELASLTF